MSHENAQIDFWADHNAGAGHDINPLPAPDALMDAMGIAGENLRLADRRHRAQKVREVAAEPARFAAHLGRHKGRL
jgi:hypothetical protein